MEGCLTHIKFILRSDTSAYSCIGYKFQTPDYIGFTDPFISIGMEKMLSVAKSWSGHFKKQRKGEKIASSNLKKGDSFDEH